MKQIVTTGIVLSRINYSEADRIVKVITPDNGKLALMARGVRKIKSKLAGGIELFSINSLTFIKGKGDICVLVSSRLQTHFGNIITEYSRTMVGYEILKLINKTTQDNCEGDYYFLSIHALTALDNHEIDPILTKCWFMINLLKLLGHTPNLRTDITNTKLVVDKSYNFDYPEMTFYLQQNGTYVSRHIKALRLMLKNEPFKLHAIKGMQDLLVELDDLLVACLKQYYT